MSADPIGLGIIPPQLRAMGPSVTKPLSPSAAMKFAKALCKWMGTSGRLPLKVAINEDGKGMTVRIEPLPAILHGH